jgi:hypothetical protein
MRKELEGGEPMMNKRTVRRLAPPELAQAIIADCDGDARAAVLALVRINSALLIELEALTGMRPRMNGGRGAH